jgi:hypothetical protein
MDSLDNNNGNLTNDDSENIKENFNRNWQYIYDNAKSISSELKKNDINGVDDLINSNPEFKIFKERFPKSWDSIITGQFSLIEFKKQRDVYNTVYQKKVGSHFDKKNLANVALGNKIAKDCNLYNGKEPSAKELQKAYEQVMAKNEIAKSNFKKQ